jgi:hypothetical protein
MKAKMYRYIYSFILIFICLTGKSQTTDGVLYTNFNNYYKWRGGAFDSTLLIPNIAASIGRRPGAIYYKSSDSSLYSWTGTQWRKVGDGAAVPTLQQVTTAGNTTTDSIISRGFIVDGITTDFSIEEDGAGSGRITLKQRGGNYASVKTGNIFITNTTTNNSTTITKTTSPFNFTNTLPDSSGVLTQRVAINGTTYNTASNGVVDIGNTDTATVVKAYVTNAEAVTITKGQVVYIFGASGDRASVKLAKNTSDTFSSKTLGIVRENIAAGAAGWITTQGQVSGINLGAYSPGDVLWLDSVPGVFTATKPVAPYHSVFVGVVERANAGNGLIYVKPQNGQELGELHDTKITSPTNNQVLAYTAATDIWENKNVTTAIGYTPLNVTDTTAMLSPYLRSNSAGVRWAGNDSTFSYQMARNGKHVNGDFDFLASANILGGNGDAINFFATIGASAGTFTALNSSGINGVTLSTSNSSTGQANIGYGYTTTLKPFSFATTDPALSTYRVKLNNLNDGTDRFFIQIGFIDAFGTNIANGYYFTYDLSGTQTGSATSANWQCVTANGSTRTWTTTSTAVATGSWATFAIRVTTSKVIFYINNSIVAEHTTNITTNNTAMSTRIIKTNGTNARTMDVDYITFDQWYSTLR